MKNLPHKLSTIDTDSEKDSDSSLSSDDEISPNASRFSSSGGWLSSSVGKVSLAGLGRGRPIRPTDKGPADYKQKFYEIKQIQKFTNKFTESMRQPGNALTMDLSRNGGGRSPLPIYEDTVFSNTKHSTTAPHDVSNKSIQMQSTLNKFSDETSDPAVLSKDSTDSVTDSFYQYLQMEAAASTLDTETKSDLENDSLEMASSDKQDSKQDSVLRSIPESASRTYVTHVINAWSFYVRFGDLDQGLKFEHEVDRYASGLDPQERCDKRRALSVETNVICRVELECASQKLVTRRDEIFGKGFEKGSKHWYRGIVMYCGRDEVDVLFVDYGISQLVGWRNIITRVPEFVSAEPQLAVFCALADVIPTGSQQYCTEESISALNDALNNEDELYATIDESVKCELSGAVSKAVRLYSVKNNGEMEGDQVVISINDHLAENYPEHYTKCPAGSGLNSDAVSNAENELGKYANVSTKSSSISTELPLKKFGEVMKNKSKLKNSPQQSDRNSQSPKDVVTRSPNSVDRKGTVVKDFNKDKEFQSVSTMKVLPHKGLSASNKDKKNYSDSRSKEESPASSLTLKVPEPQGSFLLSKNTLRSESSVDDESKRDFEAEEFIQMMTGGTTQDFGTNWNERILKGDSIEPARHFDRGYNDRYSHLGAAYFERGRSDREVFGITQNVELGGLLYEKALDSRKDGKMSMSDSKKVENVLLDHEDHKAGERYSSKAFRKRIEILTNGSSRVAYNLRLQELEIVLKESENDICKCLGACVEVLMNCYMYSSPSEASLVPLFLYDLRNYDDFLLIVLSDFEMRNARLWDATDVVQKNSSATNNSTSKKSGNKSKESSPENSAHYAEHFGIFASKLFIIVQSWRDDVSNTVRDSLLNFVDAWLNVKDITEVNTVLSLTNCVAAFLRNISENSIENLYHYFDHTLDIVKDLILSDTLNSEAKEIFLTLLLTIQLHKTVANTRDHEALRAEASSCCSVECQTDLILPLDVSDGDLSDYLSARYISTDRSAVESEIMNLSAESNNSAGIQDPKYIKGGSKQLDNAVQVHSKSKQQTFERVNTEPVLQRTNEFDRFYVAPEYRVDGSSHEDSNASMCYEADVEQSSSSQSISNTGRFSKIQKSGISAGTNDRERSHGRGNGRFDNSEQEDDKSSTLVGSSAGDWENPENFIPSAPYLLDKREEGSSASSTKVTKKGKKDKKNKGKAMSLGDFWSQPSSLAESGSMMPTGEDSGYSAMAFDFKGGCTVCGSNDHTYVLCKQSRNLFF